MVIVCSARTSVECDISCGIENCRQHLAPAAAESPPGPAKLMNSGPGVAKRNGCPASKRRAAAAPGSCHVGSSNPAVPLCSPSRTLTLYREPTCIVFLTTCSRAPNAAAFRRLMQLVLPMLLLSVLGSEFDAAFFCNIQLNRPSARTVNIASQAKTFPSAEPEESNHRVSKQRERKFRPATSWYLLAIAAI